MVHRTETYKASTSTLLRPFSRLSIPFFRRSTSTTPSLDAIHSLIKLSEEGKEGGDLDIERAKKVINGLATYAARVKERLGKHCSPDDQLLIDTLGEGYLRGFHLLSGIGNDTSNTESRQAARECLNGLTILARLVHGETEDKIKRSMCQAIFNDSTHQYPYLMPIFQGSRELTTQLEQHHLPRPGHESGVSKSLAISSSVDALGTQARHQLALLDALIVLITTSTYNSLPGNGCVGKQTKIAIKAQKLRDEDRPLRIIMEASIARCELATALASADISNVKLRSRDESRETGIVYLADSDDEDTGVGSQAEDEIEVKPTVEGEIASKAEIVSDLGDSETNPCTGSTNQVEWEEEAERTLESCLAHTCTMLKMLRPKVLTEPAQRHEWLGQGVSSSEITSPAGLGFPESDSETDSESETEEDEYTIHDGTARPAPLRAIFRLQDRYEELRLAVWLSLPPDSRGKMSAYMRGIPTAGQIAKMKGDGVDETTIVERAGGMIGKAWDELGLLLLKDFDG